MTCCFSNLSYSKLISYKILLRDDFMKLQWRYIWRAFLWSFVVLFKEVWIRRRLQWLAKYSEIGHLFACAVYLVVYWVAYWFLFLLLWQWHTLKKTVWGRVYLDHSLKVESIVPRNTTVGFWSIAHIISRVRK